MSRYATLADLLARADPDEIAQAASNDSAVTGALLAKLIGGVQLTSEPAAVRNAVSAARARAQAALDDADGTIDGYLRHRYPAAPADAADTLRAAAVDVALWRLYGGQVQGDEKSDVYARYQAAVAWLNDVAAGRIDLAPAGGASPGGARASAPTPLFTRKRLQAFG